MAAGIRRPRAGDLLRPRFPLLCGCPQLPNAATQSFPHSDRRDDRRSEILDGVQALFFERGYERSTINDVIARVGISKGGFYHHFTAKEELLKGITARLAQDAVARVRDILDDPGLSALERLNGFMARSRSMNLADAPKFRAAFDVAFRPENLLLYHGINTASIAVMRPVLTGIIAQGKAEGAFAVPDPEAEILLHLNASTHDAGARTIDAMGTAGGRGRDRGAGSALPVPGHRDGPHPRLAGREPDHRRARLYARGDDGTPGRLTHPSRPQPIFPD